MCSNRIITPAVTNSWYDPVVERALAEKLWIEDGARIITQDSDAIDPQYVFGGSGSEYEEGGGPKRCLLSDEELAALTETFGMDRATQETMSREDRITIVAREREAALRTAALVAGPNPKT